MLENQGFPDSWEEDLLNNQNNNNNILQNQQQQLPPQVQQQQQQQQQQVNIVNNPYQHYYQQNGQLQQNNQNINHILNLVNQNQQNQQLNNNIQQQQQLVNGNQQNQYLQENIQNQQKQLANGHLLNNQANNQIYQQQQQIQYHGDLQLNQNMQNQLINHQNYVQPQIAQNQNQDPRLQAAPIFHVSRGAGHDNDLKDFLDWDQQINSDRLVLNEIQRENIRDYECCICDNFFLQPVECCECDETFCLGCIENYKQRCIQTKQQQQQQAHENQNNVETPCPTCQKELVFKKAHKNTRMRLANVHIKCIFAPDCNIIETYEKLQKHQLDCKFNKIRCPNFEKCKAYFKIQDRQDHLSHCIMNELKCDLCNHEDAIFESEIQLKIHKEYVCDQNIAEKVLCSFCNELMTKDMFLKTHLLCSKAVEQISDLKNQLSVMQELRLRQESDIQTLQQKVQNYTQTISQLQLKVSQCQSISNVVHSASSSLNHGYSSSSYAQQNIVRNGIQNQAAVSQTVIRQFNGSNPHQQNFNQFMNNGQRPQNNLGVQQQSLNKSYHQMQQHYK